MADGASAERAPVSAAHVEGPIHGLMLPVELGLETEWIVAEVTFDDGEEEEREPTAEGPVTLLGLAVVAVLALRVKQPKSA